MVRSFTYVVGVICGILAVVIVCLIARKIAAKKMNKNKPQKEYDERQMIARGKAYKTGMLTFVIVTLVLTLLETLGIHFAEYPLLLLIILLAGASGFVIDAIFRNAYFRVGESTNIWWFILIGAANIVLSFVNCKNGFITEDGLLSLDSLNLIVGIWIIVIYIIVYIKKIIDKKAALSADEE